MKVVDTITRMSTLVKMYKKEEWGAERDSWRRAIGKFVGERYMKEKKK